VSSDGVGGVVLIALIAIVPIVVLMLTSFVKVSVVLALLRNALGAPEAPSGLVVMGVSLVLTFFVMAPVAVDMIRAAAPAAPAPGDPRPGPGAPGGTDAKAPAAPGGADAKAPGGTDAKAPAAPGGAGAKTPGGAGGAGAEAPVDPYPEDVGGAPVDPYAPQGRRLDVDGALRQIVPEPYRGQLDAASRAVEPLREFLGRHAAERDRETFAEVARKMGRDVRGDETWVLAPAFLATELREAFAIAVLIFVPFLVLDLVVALALAALGLQATQPQIVALPLKLLLFVAVDGWRLLIDGLLRGYA
jgi:type III secretion protein R